MSVPYFLVREMTPALRKRLEADAEAYAEPLQETIRGILCAHYLLDCSPIKGAIRNDAWGGAATVLVKLQPELFQAVKEDANASGESMRSLVLNALEAHYAAREAA